MNTNMNTNKLRSGGGILRPLQLIDATIMIACDSCAHVECYSLNRTWELDHVITDWYVDEEGGMICDDCAANQGSTAEGCQADGGGKASE